MDRTGPEGLPVVVVVDGVLAHRPPATLTMARRLAAPTSAGGPGRGGPGDTGAVVPIACVRYDRRGRGTSGFTPPYDVGREIEDLAAVLDASGPATLLGLSTGAFVALRAAADLGRRVTSVVVHRPVHDPATAGLDAWRHVVAAVESCVAEGDPGAAVELFLDVTGLPPECIDGMRRRPTWSDLEQHAPTIAHDGRLMTEAATQPSARPEPDQRVLVVRDADPAALIDAARHITTTTPDPVRER
ncbi:alpha/beta fold hydrolase [Myceligenerans cantabricum]